MYVFCSCQFVGAPSSCTSLNDPTCPALPPPLARIPACRHVMGGAGGSPDLTSLAPGQDVHYLRLYAGGDTVTQAAGLAGQSGGCPAAAGPAGCRSMRAGPAYAQEQQAVPGTAPVLSAEGEATAGVAVVVRQQGRRG